VEALVFKKWEDPCLVSNIVGTLERHQNIGPEDNVLASGVLMNIDVDNFRLW
jgi:hypothetical protein